jgi:hypothetical protein
MRGESIVLLNRNACLTVCVCVCVCVRERERERERERDPSFYYSRREQANGVHV